MPTLLKSEKLFWLLLGMLTTVAMLLLWYSTPFGLALVNDSVQYIDGARNLLLCNGYSRLVGWGGTIPITNFPPFYSFVIAFGMLLGMAPIPTTWWISLVFFGVNTALVVWIGKRLTGSKWIGLLTGVLMLLSDPFLRFHLFALTEPVFLLCFFSSLLLLDLYLERPNWSRVVMSGIFAGLTFLTRYIGVSITITAIIFLLIYSPGWKVRLKSIGLYLVGCLPVVLAWIFRNILEAGNAANRLVMLHTIATDKIEEGIISFWNWLLPETFNLVQRFLPFWGVLLVLFWIFFAIGLVIAVIHVFRKPLLKENQNYRLGVLLALQCIIYLVVLVLTILFIDASVNFETRILMPVYNLLLLLFLPFAAWFWKRKNRFIQIVLVILISGLSLSFGKDTYNTVKEFRLNGQGFANESWTQSRTIMAVRKLPDLIIYTNRPQAINLLANRGSYILLSPVNAATQQLRDNFTVEGEKIRDSVTQGRAVLVIFEYKDLVQDAENNWMKDLADGLPVMMEYEKDVIFGNIPMNSF